MAKKVYVDVDECTGCEVCVQTCPEVFQMNDDGVAEVSNQTGASEDDIQEGIDACPVQCIHWEE
jgi:ferredoxin